MEAENVGSISEMESSVLTPLFDNASSNLAVNDSKLVSKFNDIYLNSSSRAMSVSTRYSVEKLLGFFTTVTTRYFLNTLYFFMLSSSNSFITSGLDAKVLGLDILLFIPETFFSFSLLFLVLFGSCF